MNVTVGVDGNTYLTVQSLIDPQAIHHDAQPPHQHTSK